MPNERGTPFVSTTFKVRSCKVAFIWNHPTHSFVECKPTNWFGLNPPPAIEYKTKQVFVSKGYFSFPLSLYKCFNNFLAAWGQDLQHPEFHLPPCHFIHSSIGQMSTLPDLLAFASQAFQAENQDLVPEFKTAISTIQLGKPSAQHCWTKAWF